MSFLLYPKNSLPLNKMKAWINHQLNIDSEGSFSNMQINKYLSYLSRQINIYLDFLQKYWRISLRTNLSTENTSWNHIFETLENYWKISAMFPFIRLSPTLRFKLEPSRCEEHSWDIFGNSLT